jgi:hypothetical protein
MNQNGNAANGELADYFSAPVFFAPAAAMADSGEIAFGETFENWAPAPTNWSFTAIPGGTITLSQSAPHGGTNQIVLNTPGGNTSTGAHSQTATLVIDLSAQSGQTNLFLEFWVKRYWPYQGTLYLEMSGDGQNWHSILTSDPAENYVQYSIDLDQALAANGIGLNGSVFVRFRHTIGVSPYNLIDGNLYLDDVRIVAGNPSAPSLTSPARTSSGGFQFQVAGPVGNSYVIVASTNLTEWIPIATNAIPASGALLITDLDATNYSHRFYRAVSQ